MDSASSVTSFLRRCVRLLLSSSLLRLLFFLASPFAADASAADGGAAAAAHFGLDGVVLVTPGNDSVRRRSPSVRAWSRSSSSLSLPSSSKRASSVSTVSDGPLAPCCPSHCQHAVRSAPPASQSASQPAPSCPLTFGCCSSDSRRRWPWPCALLRPPRGSSGAKLYQASSYIVATTRWLCRATGSLSSTRGRVGGRGGGGRRRGEWENAAEPMSRNAVLPISRRCRAGGGKGVAKRLWSLVVVDFGLHQRAPMEESGAKDTQAKIVGLACLWGASVQAQWLLFPLWADQQQELEAGAGGIFRGRRDGASARCCWKDVFVYKYEKTSQMHLHDRLGHRSFPTPTCSAASNTSFTSIVSSLSWQTPDYPAPAICSPIRLIRSQYSIASHTFHKTRFSAPTGDWLLFSSTMSISQQGLPLPGILPPGQVESNNSTDGTDDTTGTASRHRTAPARPVQRDTAPYPGMT